MVTRTPLRRAPRLAPFKRGFTLVELLVVISIIALLISILLPSLKRARAQAQLVKCLGHMRGTAQAAIVFSNDHDGRFQVSTDEFGIGLADKSRERFSYDQEKELLTWPVALAQAAGINYKANWDWGVRASSYAQAVQKKSQMAEDLEFVTCPSDRIRIATPHYPWNSSEDPSNNGLRGSGDPEDPSPSTGAGTKYWGYLSFGINEDIAGAEVKGTTAPGCWHSVRRSDGSWFACKGQTNYPPAVGCGASGYRLRGLLERVFRPGDVGLVFECGRDKEDATTTDAEAYAALITTATSTGPYLGDTLKSDNTVGRKRVPTKRHPQGRVNVLFADMHGGTVMPVKFDSVENTPIQYSPRVRVSPYAPTGAPE